jgi:hypothetical protein
LQLPAAGGDASFFRRSRLRTGRANRPRGLRCFPFGGTSRLQPACRQFAGVLRLQAQSARISPIVRLRAQSRFGPCCSLVRAARASSIRARCCSLLIPETCLGWSSRCRVFWCRRWSGSGEEGADRIRDIDSSSRYASPRVHPWCWLNRTKTGPVRGRKVALGGRWWQPCGARGTRLVSGAGEGRARSRARSAGREERPAAGAVCTGVETPPIPAVPPRLPGRRIHLTATCPARLSAAGSADRAHRANRRPQGPRSPPRIVVRFRGSWSRSCWIQAERRGRPSGRGYKRTRRCRRTVRSVRGQRETCKRRCRVGPGGGDPPPYCLPEGIRLRRRWGQGAAHASSIDVRENMSRVHWGRRLRQMVDGPALRRGRAIS